MPEGAMRKVGIVIAAVLAALGLLAVGFFIFIAIALQSMGSNK
jgi:hypothetical protein